MNVRWQETINVAIICGSGDMTAVTVDGERPAVDQHRCRSSAPTPTGALTRHRPWTRAIWTVTPTCAKHLWEFNAYTGQWGINPDQARLRSFGCKVGDDGILR